jgi:hypothetical protein
LAGNAGNTGINITRIDHSPLTGSVSYTPNTLTNSNVIASVSFNKSGVVMTQSGGGTHHLFTGNGAFTFEFRDQAGNT